ncbi:DUF4824 family protein [Pseudomonas sp. GM48]|uniref:DUF4824 family protein n=1 Tax=Pseudomonas sp. GM48 TaxID=1144330 RepID=UPI00026FD578|nr:DUF4824 family protein [Pseudomonas sp. GM48]EJM53220.1 hypothetical protein PMI28_04318 [Pseudomonas sp. GM48]
MMNWTRRHSFIAGVGLILIANVIVLVGVIYNRSGVPDSVLKLSQRELQVPYSGRWNADNSGMSLKLLLRSTGPLNVGGSGEEGNAALFGKVKLAELGFDVSAPIDTEQGRSRLRKQRSRQVFLVLEFNGRAYQQAVELAKKIEVDELNKKQPTTLAREQNASSRLFIVDAGVNRETLRAKYPDTAQYSIVRGQIRLMVIYGHNKQTMLTGYVNKMGVERINVPIAFRSVFEPMQRIVQKNSYSAENDGRPPFEATIAFGKRLEPWIVTVSTKETQ